MVYVVNQYDRRVAKVVVTSVPFKDILPLICTTGLCPVVSVRSSEFLALKPVFVELNWLGHPKKEKKKKKEDICR